MSKFPKVVIRDGCPRCNCSEWTLHYYTLPEGIDAFFRCYACGLWENQYGSQWYDSEEGYGYHRNVIYDIEFT